MRDLSWLPVGILVSGALCFSCFVWTTLRHFVRKPGQTSGAWVVSLLSLAGFLLFLLSSLTKPPNRFWPLTVVLFGVSGLLWAWTLTRTKVSRPTLAFTEDEPCFLMDDGPYALVRHPFYTAYMIFWIGTAVTIESIAGWLILTFLAIFYWAAARHEEKKFASSALAVSYGKYAARTGRFIPKLLYRRAAWD